MPRYCSETQTGHMKRKGEEWHALRDVVRAEHIHRCSGSHDRYQYRRQMNWSVPSNQWPEVTPSIALHLPQGSRYRRSSSLPRAPFRDSLVLRSPVCSFGTHQLYMHEALELTAPLFLEDGQTRSLNEYGERALLAHARSQKAQSPFGLAPVGPLPALELDKPA